MLKVSIFTADFIFDKEFLDELHIEEVKANLNRDAAESCNCLPSCTSITYRYELTQADFRWNDLFRAFEANISEFPG